MGKSDLTQQRLAGTATLGEHMNTRVHSHRGGAGDEEGGEEG